VASQRSEHAEALRSSVERLCHLAATEDLEILGFECRKLEQALAGLAADVEALRAERDAARDGTRSAELQLTATRQILEEGPDGFIITDRAGLITHVNRAATQLLGLSARFLVRKPLSLFIDEADLRIFRWRVNNARPGSHGEWPIRMRPREGAPFMAGLTVTAFAGTGDDKAPDLRWFVRDIGARQRAEELAAAQEVTNQMLESEQNARAAAESARRALELQVDVSGQLAATLDHPAALTAIADLIVPVAADVFLVDLLVDGRLEQAAMACSDAAGAERLRARRPPDPAGDHPIARVIHSGEPLLAPDIARARRESWADSREAGKLWTEIGLTSVMVVPIRSHRQTHGAVTFGLRATARRYTEADLRVFTDIGVRIALALDTARLFKALETEQRHRDEFLAMLAHELRNPLGAVTNGLEALERCEAADRGPLLQILGRQSRHLARLLNDLLDVSGVRFGRLMLQQSRLDLRDLARQSLEVLRTAGNSNGPSIALRTDPHSVTVMGDADRLMQVIANLLDNAVKYTPRDGSVEIVVEAENGDAVVRVRDSGIGIAPEFLPRIFELFSRGHDTRGPSRPGLGLGLSVVRELVVKHGGSVSASSGGVGKGSEFVIRLPVHNDTEPQSPTLSSASASERSILVVEDNPDAAEALRLALELSGHRVSTATNGQQAIDRALAEPPDVALVDIGLPDIDGCEVGRVVRHQPGGDGVYLVAISGHGTPADRDRALRSGFDSFLVKPVAPDDLRDVIAQAPTHHR
jgi:PAS domain S-box-containing protein